MSPQLCPDVALNAKFLTPDIDSEGDFNPLGIGHGEDSAHKSDQIEYASKQETVLIDAMPIEVVPLVEQF